MMDALRSNKRYSDVSETKSEGATYTPQALADFVANQIVSAADLPVGRPIRVMDPAIGHGELLLNLLPKLEGPIEVYGFETNPAAIEVAKKKT